MEKQRPVGLIVLAILSWIWIGFALLSLFSEISRGPFTDAQLRNQEITLIQSQTPETIEMMPWVVSDTTEMLKITRDSFWLLNGINLVHLFLGLIAVILMFRMKKIGFHLYIIYSLTSVIYWTYFFGGYNMGVALAIFSAFFSGLFVLFYALLLKHMKQ